MAKPQGKNFYKVNGSVVTVYLNNTKNPMICDLDVWNKYKQYTWNELHGYATAAIKHRPTYFHRLAVGEIPEGYVVDHVNRTPLDNRKCNLRITTAKVNNINTGLRKNNKTGYAGITKDKYGYIANINVNKKRVYLGYFKELQDAVNARKEAEIKYHKAIIEKETLQTGCFF